MNRQALSPQVAGLFLAVVTAAGSSIYCDDAHAADPLDCQRIANQIPYQPLSPARLDNSKRKFNRSLQTLQSRLGRQGKEFRSKWMKYLKGTELVGRNQHGYEEINLFRRWLFSSAEGVEHKVFADVRRDVGPYNDVLYTAQFADLHGEHLRHLQGLTRACWAVNSNPVSENLLAVQTHLTWFSRTKTDAGYASALFAAWRRPNVRLQIPGHFITDKFYENDVTVQEQGPVNETFCLPIGFRGKNQAVQSTGCASTYGTASIHLIPSAEVARFMVKVDGQINSNTQSNNGPVNTKTNSVSRFQSRAILDGSIEGIELKSIDTDVHIVSMDSQYTGTTRRPRVNRLFARVAERKSQKAEVQAAIQSQNKAAVRRQLKEKIQEQIGDFTEDQEIAANLEKSIKDKMGNLGEKLSKPFEREGVKIDRVVLGTGLDHVAVRLEVGDSGRLLSLDREPINPSPNDIHLAFHQSALNNMFQVAYAGKWVNDDYFEKATKLMYTEAPYELYTHSRKEDWAIKYADVNPVTFALDSKEQIVVTVRAAGFKRRGPGEKQWKVTLAPATYVVTYRIAEDQHGDSFLEKTNRLASVPSENALNEEDRAFMSRMEERINAFLGEDLNMGGLTVPKGGPMTELKNVKAFNFNLSNGWISYNVSNLPKIFDEAK